MNKRYKILIAICGFGVLIVLSLIALKHESWLVRLSPYVSGRTNLHWAAWDGRNSAVEKLLEKEANINCRDKDGYTPLHLAALKGRKKTVHLLILHGADVNAREYIHEGTPLHEASALGRVEIVQMLIDAGADVNAENKKGWTPLDCAVAMSNRLPRYHPFRLILGRRLSACAKVLRENRGR